MMMLYLQQIQWLGKVIMVDLVKLGI